MMTKTCFKAFKALKYVVPIILIVLIIPTAHAGLWEWLLNLFGYGNNEIEISGQGDNFIKTGTTTSYVLYPFEFQDSLGTWQNISDYIDFQRQGNIFNLSIKNHFRVQFNVIPTLNNDSYTWQQVRIAYPNIRHNVVATKYNSVYKFDLNLTNGDEIGENLPNKAGLILSLIDSDNINYNDVELQEDGLRFFNKWKLEIPQVCDIKINKTSIWLTNLSKECLDPTFSYSPNGTSSSGWWEGSNSNSNAWVWSDCDANTYTDVQESIISTDDTDNVRAFIADIQPYTKLCHRFKIPVNETASPWLKEIGVEAVYRWNVSVPRSYNSMKASISLGNTSVQQWTEIHNLNVTSKENVIQRNGTTLIAGLQNFITSDKNMYVLMALNGTLAGPGSSTVNLDLYYLKINITTDAPPYFQNTTTNVSRARILSTDNGTLQGENVNFSVQVLDDVEVDKLWFFDNFDIIQKQLLIPLITGFLSATAFGQNQWRAQTFTMPINGYVYQICGDIRSYSSGSSHVDKVIALKDVTTESLIVAKPTGNDLGNISFSSMGLNIALRCGNLSTPYYAPSNKILSLVFHDVYTAGLTTTTRLRYRASAMYSGGRYGASTDAGSSWSMYDYVTNFTVYIGEYNTTNQTFYPINLANQYISINRTLTTAPIGGSQYPFTYGWCANDTAYNQVNCTSRRFYAYDSKIIDTLFPSWDIISPPNKSAIGGTFPIVGTATDNQAISFVFFQYFNQSAPSPVWTNMTECNYVEFPYTCGWETTKYSNGTSVNQIGHYIRMVPVDTFGNTNFSNSSMKFFIASKNTPIETCFARGDGSQLCPPYNIIYEPGKISAKQYSNISIYGNFSSLNYNFNFSASKIWMRFINGTLNNVTEKFYNGNLSLGNWSWWGIANITVTNTSTGTEAVAIRIDYEVRDTGIAYGGPLFSQYLFNLDNQAPNYTNYQIDTSLPYYQYHNITISLIAQDNFNLSFYTFAVSNSTLGGWQNQSYNFTYFNQYQETIFNTTQYAQGNWSVYYILYDNAGNINTTTNLNFNVSLTLPVTILPMYLTNATGSVLNSNITAETNETINITSSGMIPEDANITLYIQDYEDTLVEANISQSFLQNFTTFWTNGSFLISLEYLGNDTWISLTTNYYVDVNPTTTSSTSSTTVAVTTTTSTTSTSSTLPHANLTLYLRNSTSTIGNLYKNITALTNESINITSSEPYPADVNMTLYVMDYVGINQSRNTSKSFLQNFTTFWTTGSFLINITWEGNLTMFGNSTAFWVDVNPTSTTSSTTSTTVPQQIAIDIIYPTGGYLNVTKNEVFNITVNVTCLGANCGYINISLDPIELPEKTIAEGTKEAEEFMKNMNKQEESLGLPSAENESIIIELKDTPLIKYDRNQFFMLKYIGMDSYVNQKKKIQRNQDNLVEDINELGYNTELTQRFANSMNGIVLNINSNDVEKIKEMPNVKAVYKNEEVHVLLQDSIPLINATQVNEKIDENGDYVNGTGITVAIIDTGVNYSHGDLGSCFGSGCRVIYGYDFVNSDSDPYDDHGHGTHVAGIVGASGNITGIAPGVKFVIYKALNSAGSGTAANVISAIENATNYGVDIISMSLGGSGYTDSVYSTSIQNAVDAGIPVVIAAGNDGAAGYYTTDSPGADLNAITVGAINKSNTIADFSSRGYALYSNGSLAGIKPDIVSYGVDINSTLYNGTGIYGKKSGTSMSTPMVAGVVALVKQAHPTMTAKQIKSAIANPALDLGYDPNTQGSGRVNAFASYNITATITDNNIFIYNRLNNTEVYRNTTITLNMSGVVVDRLINYTLSIEFFNTTSSTNGITLGLTNYTIALGANKSFEFNFTSQVDRTRIASNTYNGKLRIISAEGQNYTVPFSIYVFNDYLKGLIPTTYSNPFYTTSNNPNVTSLNANQSQIINFNVIPTGNVNREYMFFAFANSSTASNTSRYWNVTILNAPQIYGQFFNLNDNNGSLTDSGTAIFNATILNKESSNVYPLGVGFNFNGTNQSVTISNNNWVNLAGGTIYAVLTAGGYFGDSFTKSVWFNTSKNLNSEDVDSINSITLMYHTSNSRIYLINNSKIYVAIQNYTNTVNGTIRYNWNITPPNNLNDSNWHNLILNWNNSFEQGGDGNLSVWLDGIIINSTNFSLGFRRQWILSTLLLGNWEQNLQTDEFRAYYNCPNSISLTETQIREIYNNGRGRNESLLSGLTNQSLATWISLDEGNGQYLYVPTIRNNGLNCVSLTTNPPVLYTGLEQWGTITHNYTTTVLTNHAGVYPYYWFTTNASGQITNQSETRYYTVLVGTTTTSTTSTSTTSTSTTTTLPKAYLELWLNGTRNANLTTLTNQSVNITVNSLTPADANITLFLTNYAGVNVSFNHSRSFLQNATNFWTDGNFLANVSWEGNLTMFGNSTSFYIIVIATTTTSSTSSTSSTTVVTTTTTSTSSSLPQSLIELYLNGTYGNITLIANQSVNITGYAITPASANFTLYVNGTKYNYTVGFLQNFTTFWNNGSFNITLWWEGNLTYKPNTTTWWVQVGITKTLRDINTSSLAIIISLLGMSGIFAFHSNKLRKNHLAIKTLLFILSLSIMLVIPLIIMFMIDIGGNTALGFIRNILARIYAGYMYMFIMIIFWLVIYYIYILFQRYYQKRSEDIEGDDVI